METILRIMIIINDIVIKYFNIKNFLSLPQDSINVINDDLRGYFKFIV